MKKFKLIIRKKKTLRLKKAEGGPQRKPSGTEDQGRRDEH